jgi:hypothetical protein
MEVSDETVESWSSGGTAGERLINAELIRDQLAPA